MVKSEVLTIPIHIEIQKHLDSFNLDIKITEFRVSTKTSQLAAEALGVEVGQIAKTMLLLADGEPILFVTCGDVRIDTKKLGKMLGVKKLRFADAETVETVTGYPVGGVCPYKPKSKVKILLDNELSRFKLVYTAAGTPFSAVPVTLEQLKEVTGGDIVSIGQMK